jgi:hypothetical protein
MQSNGLRVQYYASSDRLASTYANNYAPPSSVYPANSPSMSSDGFSPPMNNIKFESTSYAPPPDVFLDGYKRPMSESTADSNAGRSRSSAQLDVNDSVAMHLLVETAMGDSQDYEVLSFEEVESLKKEMRILHSRIQAVSKKLALETKLRDAAQSINRLYSKKQKGSESDSPQRRRKLSLSQRSSSGSIQNEMVQKAENEMTTSARKCEDLSRELWQLESRYRHIQTQLLKHTAGILQMTHDGPSRRKDGMRSILPDGMTQGGRPDSPASIDNYEVARRKGYKPMEEMFDERSLYRSPDNIDNLLDGPAANPEANKTLISVETRLEELNTRLRDLLVGAGPENAQAYAQPASDKRGQVEHQLDYLDRGLRDLGAEQSNLLLEQNNLQKRIKQSRSEIEGRLETINNQLAALINNSQSMEDEPYPLPPRITGQGSQDQINYLDEAMYTMQQLNESILQALAHARSQASEESSQHTAAMSDLWNMILSSEEESRRRKQQQREQIRANPESLDKEEDLSADEDGISNEAFSVQGFSARVQRLVTRTSRMREQQAILRRQIRMQRDLNGKSDAQREEQVSELTSQLQLARGQHAEAEQELANTVEELGRLRILDEQRSVSGQQVQAEQNARLAAEERLHQLEEELAAVQDDAQIELSEMKMQLSQATSEREAAELKAQEKEKELHDLESEMVRLQTEVTVAKAELDGAYGSRAQRAQEAEWNPEVQKKIESLSQELATAQASEKTLRDELKGMIGDYEILTRDCIQMEKDRDNYEAMIDTLRDEKEKLETELSDEKVRWLGVRSPGSATASAPEMTSVRMLREDFRRLMREKTTEALRALRVSGYCLYLLNDLPSL